MLFSRGYLGMLIFLDRSVCHSVACLLSPPLESRAGCVPYHVLTFEWVIPGLGRGAAQLVWVLWIWVPHRLAEKPVALSSQKILVSSWDAT